MQKNSDSDVVVAAAWTRWVLYPICILVSVQMMRREVQQTERNHVGYHRWLDKFALSAMLFYTLHLCVVLLNKIQTICTYSYLFSSTFLHLGHNTVLLYQTVRLEHCFSSQRVHSDFGYSRFTFAVMYVVIAIMDCACFCLFLVWTVHDHAEFGCEVLTNGDVYVLLSGSLGGLLIAMFALVTMLSLIKLQQVKTRHRASSGADKKEVVFQKINEIIVKISSLLLLFVLKGTVLGGVVVPLKYMNFVYHDSIVSVLNAADQLTSIYLVSLMVERNDEKYLELLSALCCCINVTEDNKKRVLSRMISKASNRTSVPPVVDADVATPDTEWTSTHPVKTEHSINDDLFRIQADTLRDTLRSAKASLAMEQL